MLNEIILAATMIISPDCGNYDNLKAVLLSRYDEQKESVLMVDESISIEKWSNNQKGTHTVLIRNVKK